MKKGLLVFGIIVIAWIFLTESGTWRYKLTVVVETPEGIKTGSAVREVHVFSYPGMLGMPGKQGASVEVKGEAVVVDLGKRGVLFAIMGINGSYEIVYEAFPSFIPPLTNEGVAHYKNLYKKIGDKKVVLDPKKHRDYPKLVTFTDINDPKTVKIVVPDKLDEVFGEGVKLKEIYVQMTDEPVTWGVVDSYLPKSFEEVIIKGWRKLSFDDRVRIAPLIQFKRGEK